MKNKIIAKVKLGLPLTKHEEALYVLFFSSMEEMHKYYASRK